MHNHLQKSGAGRVTVQLWPDKTKFLHAYAERWLANEAENIAFLRLSPHTFTADALCFSLHNEQGEMVQTAVFTPNDQIILTNGTDDSTSTLCTYLVEQGHEVPGLFAPVPTSRLAAKLLQDLTGKQYHLAKELLHLELKQPPKSRSVDGTCQAATSQDLDHLTNHRIAIQAKSNTQRPFDSAKSVRSDIRDGALYQWVSGSGQIVASGSIYYDRMPTSAYLNHIYVEPTHRRQGYATALVSQLCEDAQAQERVPRLSVDAANQPAYQAYLKLGFALAARMDNFRAM
ncbi:MAG: GNAT family N-acetyltransferase [Chloroflexota bacterium]